MTQPSPADELRAAAEKLRQHAATASPGPWRIHLPNGYPQAIYSDEDENAILAEVLDEIDQPKPNAPYIALMHPGVGHALAKLLDRQGRIAREVQDHLGAEFQDGALDQNVHDALAVARAITGSQS